MAIKPLGTTMAFATTSTFAPKIVGMSIGGTEVSKVGISHFGTTAYREYLSGALLEPFEVTVRYLWEGNSPPVGVTESVTITFPTGGGSIAGTGFTLSGPEIDADNIDDDAVTAEFVFAFDGLTGPTITPPA